MISRQIFKHYFNDESGSIIMMVAGLIVVLVLLCGAVIDFGMARIIQNKVQQASVAAILASNQQRSDASDSDIAQDARKYFALNFTDDYLRSSITPADLEIDVTRDQHQQATVRVRLNDVEIRTAFLDALGLAFPISHRNGAQVQHDNNTD
ncbi:MAG: pilus assembly protein TadG-related protein [Rickettsiales bacterium]|nr:pilus assembly protein TadG-related protein [Rickettsiales bacterium]